MLIGVRLVQQVPRAMKVVVVRQACPDLRVLVAPMEKRGTLESWALQDLKERPENRDRRASPVMGVLTVNLGPLVLWVLSVHLATSACPALLVNRERWAYRVCLAQLENLATKVTEACLAQLDNEDNLDPLEAMDLPGLLVLLVNLALLERPVFLDLLVHLVIRVQWVRQGPRARRGSRE